VSRRPVRAYAVALAAAATLLAGCGDDDPPKADPSTPTASSSSPSASASPSVEPATGKQLVSKSFTIRVPEGWRADNGQSGGLLTTRYAGDEKPDGTLVAFLSTSDGSALADQSLAKLAKEKARSSEFQQAPEILGDVDVAGVTMYHLAGKTSANTYAINLGTIHDDDLVEIHIESSLMSQEELEQTFDSILATWEWTDG
jgi:hypothetical protein